MDEPPIGREPDDYERQYMDADRALFVARVRQRLWLRLALAALFFAMVVVNVRGFLVIAPRLWPLRHASPGLVAAIFAMYGYLAASVLWFPVDELLGAITRAVLTPTHFRVHRGFMTTDVPLAAVTSVTVERTRRWFPRLPAFRGLRRKDTVYQSFRTKQSVRVEWHDERGRARRVWVYLDEAEALRERIEMLRGGGTGVRVTLDEEGAAADAGEGMEGAEVEATVEAKRRVG